MRTLKAEIISVGTELLLGQIENTNTTWLSQELALNGINTYYHTTVGDNFERLKKSFQAAQKRSNVIIVTGGLGPTEDDLTREAFQAMTGLEIIEDKASLDKIKQFFIKQKLTMTDNNKRQARVFEGAKVLTNKTGMAPGMVVEQEEKIWVFLPGVPREMKQMARDDVFPYLKERNGQTLISSTVLRFIGIGESILEDKLKTLIDTQTNPTLAPLSSHEGMTIRLTARAGSVHEAESLLEEKKKEILALVGDYYYGCDDISVPDAIVTLLAEKELRLASAESLTGGRFSDKIITRPGASMVCRGGIVCYDEQVKRQLLKVNDHIIDKYGTVSEACAREMARNVAHLLEADIGISFTGVAGPEPVENKPVGTVYIGLHSKDGYEKIEKFNFQGTRKMIRSQAVLKGLELLLKYLK